MVEGTNQERYGYKKSGEETLTAFNVSRILTFSLKDSNVNETHDLGYYNIYILDVGKT